MTTHIIDVSKYQAERNNPLEPVKARTAGFTVLNIALDRGRDDDILPSWAPWYAAQARVLGMGICTYRWLDNRLTGAASARRAYDRIVTLGGPDGMAHAVDCESNATEQIVRDYLNTITELLGRPVALYSADWWWTVQGRNWPMAGLTPYLWAAPNDGYRPAYPGDNSNDWHAGWGGWQNLSVLQYSVKPLPGETDDNSMSAIRDPAVWTALTGTGGAVPTRSYASWVAAGRPNSGLARPAARLRDRLRKYGYTVYDMGDQSHLTHVPPEDHTPYSDTGWPVDPPLWWITAIDIMPPRSGSGLPSLAALGKQIHDDRSAGDPQAAWVKYMNWEPGNGSCIHCSWQPTHAQQNSTDRGHIHISTRGDVYDYAGGDDYDPVARVRGLGSKRSDDDDMVAIWYDGKGYGRGNGVISTPVQTWPEMVLLQQLINQGVFSGSSTIRNVTPELSRAYGQMVEPSDAAAALDLTAVQTAIKELSDRLASHDNDLTSDSATIVDAIVAAVRSNSDTLNANMEKLSAALAENKNGLPADQSVIVQALKQALREGTGQVQGM